MKKHDLDEFLRALAAYYLPEYENVLIETQEQADVVNEHSDIQYRVGDLYRRRMDKPLRILH